MNTPINLSNKYWKTKAGIATFTSKGPAWGVLKSSGKILAKNGEPCVWNTKKNVEQNIAPYADGFKGHEWIDVYDSLAEAQK